MSDYAGEWQSVYPYLKDGTLDQVFDYKAKLTGKMTAAEYKDYYDKGYKTDVSNINITDKTMEFLVDGKSKKYTYKYVGKHTLTYSKEIVEYDLCLKRQIKMLVNTSMFSLATTTLHQLRRLISISSMAVRVRKHSLTSWKTGQPTIQSKLTGQEIAQEMLAH